MTTLDDIFDQDQAVRWLRAAVESDRLPHALLFAGPCGVGKGTTAFALSAAFLCERPRGAAGCGNCASCRAMIAGVHPDYHLVYRQLIRLERSDAAARDLSIDTLRDHLIAPSNLKPSLGRGKVFVVEEAETMNPHGQNALLKTLEEPQGRTLIILLTDSPNSLLPTIRSRSQLVRFRALPIARVKSELVRRGVSVADATDAAAMTDGSLGSALRWLQDGLVPAGRELLSAIDELPESAPRLSQWFRQFADAYVKAQQAREDARAKAADEPSEGEREEKVSKDVTSREGLQAMLRLAAGRFRERLMSADDESAPIRCEQIEATIEAAGYLDRNVNVWLVMENLVQRWSQASG